MSEHALGTITSHSFILNTNLIDRLILSSDISHDIISDITHIVFTFIYLFFLHFLKVLFYIGVELINNVRIVAGVQQSDSVIYISILFQILFPFRLLQNIEQSSQCYTVGPCCLSILNMIHVNPKLPNVKRKEESKKRGEKNMQQKYYVSQKAYSSYCLIIRQINNRLIGLK